MTSSIRIADLLVRDFSKASFSEAIDDIVSVSNGDIHASAALVLLKKESQQVNLRELFHAHGASLMQSVKLERCSLSTECNEEQFVRYYPYLPHLIALSIEIDAAMPGNNRLLAAQLFEMLRSDRTNLIRQPMGILVTVDKIYEIVERNLSPEKQKDVREICKRFDEDTDYPGMASRVAKALCVMEFVQADLPRTTRNIAALLVQRVTDAPPLLAVAALLSHMQDERFVRENEDGWKLYDFDGLRRAASSLVGRRKLVGVINPRLPGWHNGLIQAAKRLLARVLNWYTRPIDEFNGYVASAIEEIVWTLDHLSTNLVSTSKLVKQTAGPMEMVALEARLTRSEKRIATLAVSMREQLELLQEQVHILGGFRTDSRLPIDTGLGKDRTAYLIGLFGTGRRYINELILGNIGERAKYFRDTIRLHAGPTPMIYSGHATVRHVSRLQYQPSVTREILESVRSGFADLIFVYRHPLDSLLTNWVWWRQYIHDNRSISGISQIYKNTADLSADLDRDFLDFEAFAEGDPEFFAGAPGPGFLSFREFVEETELFFQSSTLCLRLEDFMIDPAKEFSKVAAVMSVDLDTSGLSLAPPTTKAYGFLAVKEKVPRFKNFIDSLDAETRKRIEKMGYGANGLSQASMRGEPSTRELNS